LCYSTGIISSKKGMARIRIIAESRPYWEWAIERFGSLAWTWMAKDDGYWKHPPGLEVFHPAGKMVAIRDLELLTMMTTHEVDVLLFDMIAPRVSHQVWNSSLVKLVI
jgi:hypothetical protein